MARRLLANEPVPLRWHGEAKPFLAAVPDPSNPWTEHGAELAPKVDPDIADAMRRGTFNPYAVDELNEYAYQFQRVVDVTAHLTFLRDFLTARGVRLRIAYLPYPGQVSDYYIPFKHRFGGREVTSMSGPQFQVQAAHLADVAARLATCRFSISRRRSARAKRRASISTGTTIITCDRRAMRSSPMRSTHGRAHLRQSERRSDGGDIVAPGVRARQPICFSSVSASETSYFPGASMLRIFTTPLSTSIEKRWQRMPRPFAVRSNSRPSALV